MVVVVLTIRRVYYIWTKLDKYSLTSTEQVVAIVVVCRVLMMMMSLYDPEQQCDVRHHVDEKKKHTVDDDMPAGEGCVRIPLTRIANK